MSSMVVLKYGFLAFRRIAPVLSLLLICSASSVIGQDKKDAATVVDAPRRVHFILCGLTKDATIGDAIDVSIQNLEQMLRNQVAEEYVAGFKILKDDDCNAEKILDRLNTIDVKKNDALYCYYAGHGAYDRALAANDPSGGHHFQIPSGDLIRKKLFDQMQSKGARLTVLISDTCNIEAYAQPKMTPEMRVKSATIRGNTDMETLLLLHRGVVDINASTKDQFSWFSPSVGGWFSSVLCSDLPRYKSWKAMFDQLSKDTDEFYRKKRQETMLFPGRTSTITMTRLRNQEHMQPQAFRFKVERDGPESLTNRERTIEIPYTTWRAVQ